MVGIGTQGLLFKRAYAKKNKDEWLCECKNGLEELGYLGSKIQRDALNGPKDGIGSTIPQVLGPSPE
jgi:hypothetical protein